MRGLTDKEKEIVDSEYAKHKYDNYRGDKMTRYISGQQAINEGTITEKHWQQAIAHPWTWVIISDNVKAREIPWQGLEIEITNCEVKI